MAKSWFKTLSLLELAAQLAGARRECDSAAVPVRSVLLSSPCSSDLLYVNILITATNEAVETILRLSCNSVEKMTLLQLLKMTRFRAVLRFNEKIEKKKNEWLKLRSKRCACVLHFFLRLVRCAVSLVFIMRTNLP